MYMSLSELILQPKYDHNLFCQPQINTHNKSVTDTNVYLFHFPITYRQLNYDKLIFKSYYFDVSHNIPTRWLLIFCER